MNTTPTIVRKQTAFRLREDLIERLRVKAKKENRSLNNYVEKLLSEMVFDEPNEETIKAIEEAKDEKNLSTLDLKKFKEFVASL